MGAIQETQEESQFNENDECEEEENSAAPETQLDAHGEEADDESGLSENEEQNNLDSDDEKDIEPPPVIFDNEEEQQNVTTTVAADSDEGGQISDNDQDDEPTPPITFENAPNAAEDSDESNLQGSDSGEGEADAGNVDETHTSIQTTQHIMSDDEKGSDEENEDGPQADVETSQNQDLEESAYNKSVSFSEQIDTAAIPQELNSDDDGDAQFGGETGEAPVQNELINDIFGSSDSEGEFEGFGEDELMEKDMQQQANEMGERPKVESDEDDKISDFDKMLMKKKEESAKRRRKRKDVDIINDQDDKILNMITLMRRAADDDRELNRNKRVALNKLKLLNSVLYELRKCHLQSAFVENGVLLSIAEWLNPLPDQSLPHLHIRTSMLQILEQFPPLDSAMLRESGIGKVVMLLYKHPKEVRENRIRAGKLINNWARPIFQLTADFGSMSREDREKRDLEKMPPQKKKKTNPEKKREDEEEDGPKGPGDRGFIARARVPMPSFKDYVVRPKMNLDMLDDEDMKKRRNVKREKSRLDKYMSLDRERKSKAKNTHAVKVNLCGGKT